MYPLDSSTIDFCLSVIDLAKIRREKGGIKIHFLFDIKSQIPAFNVITTAKEADVTVAKTMKVHLTPDSIVTFDRAYVDFNLFQSYQAERCFFVTRNNSNLRFELLGQLPIPKKKVFNLIMLCKLKIQFN